MSYCWPYRGLYFRSEIAALRPPRLTESVLALDDRLRSTDAAQLTPREVHAVNDLLRTVDGLTQSSRFARDA